MTHNGEILLHRLPLKNAKELIAEVESFNIEKAAGRLRGLAVACWTTDHYHPCSNLGVGISEGCFIFDFSSLPSDVARPI